jgi:MFS transporter, DHA3 family, macrolide efflux protein
VAALWVGLATAAIGDQLYAVALSWIAVGLFGAAAGYLTALQAVAVLATAMFGGHWADRREHRRMMIGADLARAAVLILVVAVWATLDRPPAWGLVLAVLVIAAGHALFSPALQAIVPDLVSTPALLPATNALLDATDSIARLLGPGIVTLLAASLPMMHFFTLDAAAFVVSAVAVLIIGRTRNFAPVVPPVREQRFLDSMVRGFRAMWRQRLLSYVLLSSGVLNGVWFGTIFLGLPLFIERNVIVGTGGKGLAVYGLVMSCYGSTNLLASLIVGGRALPARPAWLLGGGNLVFSMGIVLLGAVMLDLAQPAGVPWLMAAAALAAFGRPMGAITTATLRQTLLPRRDVAAATRATMVVTNVGMLVVMLLMPPAVDAYGIAPVVIAGGSVIAGISIAGLFL